MPYLKEPIETAAQILLTDSRKILQPANSIFFAIKGDRHNGHQYIAELYAQGVRAFVVQDIVDKKKYPDAKFWLVKNTVKALQNFVAEHRAKIKNMVVGITGSNGKTIVKEWLSTLLANHYSVVKSPKSYNSQIGVPLSIWEMHTGHDIGVFEAGISKVGEMENLEPIIRPDIGIFTNIGSAHDEGFKSYKQKTIEKLKLFRHSQVLIYCQDYPEINEEVGLLLKAVNPKIELIAWSKAKEGYYAANSQRVGPQSNIMIHFTGKPRLFQVPFTDDASIENICHCIFVLLYLKIPTDAIQAALILLKPVAMRLELKQGINNCYLIDDSYNNDLVGLTMALNFMDQHASLSNKVLILSDLLQAGIPEIELYKTIATLIKTKGIQQIIGIGPLISRLATLFDKNAIFYPNTEVFLENYPMQDFNHKLILVKGARSFSFEKIINRLVQKVHGTVFEINLDALTHNLNYYKQKIGSETKIMVMVKAYAYGSGSAEVASLLAYNQVDYLGVAYPDEGITLRKANIKLPIMVLNAAPDTFDKLLEYNLEPEIYGFRILGELIQFVLNQKIKKPILIHLKLDTGMHRLGFLPSEIDDLLLILAQNPMIRVASIFSHLVGADEAIHNDFSNHQIKVFKQMATKISQKLSYSVLKHICNSAGIIRFPDAKFDMVRLGIGLYGVEATAQEPQALNSIGTLKTVISQIKHLKAGDTVGYSRKGVLERDSHIATIAIGYADGFDRRFSGGKGVVLINGTRCPIIGNVCMDMSMVDVTRINCQEGDEVIVFGKDLSISELATNIGTIPYEILTGINERVKRIFYTE